jgi:hypothetical protein
MSQPRDAEIALARRFLLLVGLCYLIAQLALFSIDRAPGWDESIYLSQVTPGAEPLLFAPSRARGITFVVAPILQLGGSLPLVRLFLIGVAAVALAASYRMWAPVVGLGAPAAALLFAGSWPALFYGSEIMPNLWAAFPAVVAVAVLARRVSGVDRRYDELIAGGSIALMGLVRPLDALVLAVVLLVLPLVARHASAVWSAHIVLGFAAGWAPWLVEMSGRFGGPLAALEAAARVGHAGRWSVAENVRQYLALSDGPTAGPVPHPTVPRSGLYWLVGLTVLLLLGLRDARRRGALPFALVPTAAGLALAAGYVVLTAAQAPRFLLPALALLSVPAGLGLVAVLRGLRPPVAIDRPRVAGGFASAVLLIAWIASQLTVATKIEAGVTPHRESAERAGIEVGRLAASDPCQVYSSASYPMVGYASGCRATPVTRVSGRWEARAKQLRGNGIEPIAVFLRRAAPDPPEGTSLVADVRADGRRSWFIFAVR